MRNSSTNDFSTGGWIIELCTEVPWSPGCRCCIKSSDGAVSSVWTGEQWLAQRGLSIGSASLW
jgi:hypothetical protein